MKLLPLIVKYSGNYLEMIPSNELLEYLEKLTPALNDAWESQSLEKIRAMGVISSNHLISVF